MKGNALFQQSKIVSPYAFVLQENTCSFLKASVLNLSFSRKPVLTNSQALDEHPSYAVPAHPVLLIPCYFSHGGLIYLRHYTTGSMRVSIHFLCIWPLQIFSTQWLLNTYFMKEGKSLLKHGLYELIKQGGY